MADIRTVLNQRLRESNEAIDFTIADLSAEQLHAIHDGGTIGSPASIYFHVAWVEDLIVNQMLQGAESLYDRAGWIEKLPGAQPHRGPSTLEWARAVRVDDIAALTSYAATVREATAAYINGLSDDEFDREISFFTGPTAQVNVLTWLGWNTANHTGEIAALRGIAGLKGLPY